MGCYSHSQAWKVKYIGSGHLYIIGFLAMDPRLSGQNEVDTRSLWKL